MKIIVTGATGMVGSELVRQALEDPEISEVIAVVRNILPLEHLRLRVVIHNNFMDYDELSSLFASCHACIWCLGVSQLQVSRKEYHVITYDYTVAAANAMLASNPGIIFVLVSGEGADPEGRARTLFGQVKGKTEKALMEMPFQKLMIARPAGIMPVSKNPRAPLAYRLFYSTYPIWKLLTPSRVITSVQLAKALLELIKKPAGNKIVYSNRELKDVT
ncbi:MAG TPA: NAD(P)H-binding protein [Chitinophagaceae bacterium]|nr:NAD(P)H-binding protein [Chitinophagaceae bacterium]